MANFIGKNPWRPSWMKPPCQGSKCRDAADTTGLVNGKLVNLCSKCKMLADRKLQRGGRRR